MAPSRNVGYFRTFDDETGDRRPPDRKRAAAAHGSDLDGFCRLPIPGQQLVESIDWMSVDHALEHVMQVRVGFDVVHFGGLNERAERRPARPAAIRPGEQMILAPKCNRADRALDWIGVELDATVVQESREAMPTRQCITDRIGELAAVRRAAELLQAIGGAPAQASS